MAFETEVIDKLFLELSQITQAATARELRYRKALEYIAKYGAPVSADAARFALKEEGQPNG